MNNNQNKTISYILNKLCNNSLSINQIIKLLNQINAKKIPLVKRYCTQKIGQNIQLFLFSILNFKVSKFYYF